MALLNRIGSGYGMKPSTTSLKSARLTAKEARERDNEQLAEELHGIRRAVIIKQKLANDFPEWIDLSSNRRAVCRAQARYMQALIAVQRRKERAAAVVICLTAKSMVLAKTIESQETIL